MAENYLYCYINIFDYEQSIYLNKGDGNAHLVARVPFTEIGKIMPTLCRNQGTDHVMLSCKVPGMAEQAKEAIIDNETKCFGFSAIEVEIV